MIHQHRLFLAPVVTLLVVAGFVALSGRADAATPTQQLSDGYDCSDTLRALMVSHPGTTWVQEGGDLVLLNDYGEDIRVPCSAPGQLPSLGPPVGVWEGPEGIEPPSQFPLNPGQYPGQ